MPEMTPFPWFRAYLWKIAPFFAEVGTSVVYVLVGARSGVGGAGISSNSTPYLSGVPDLWDRNKILSGGDLSHYPSAPLY